MPLIMVVYKSSKVWVSSVQNPKDCTVDILVGCAPRTQLTLYSPWLQITWNVFWYTPSVHWRRAHIHVVTFSNVLCAGWWVCFIARLPWEQLFEPVVNISENGFHLTEHGGESYRTPEIMSCLLLLYTRVYSELHVVVLCSGVAASTKYFYSFLIHCNHSIHYE